MKKSTIIAAIGTLVGLAVLIGLLSQLRLVRDEPMDKWEAPEPKSAEKDAASLPYPGSQSQRPPQEKRPRAKALSEEEAKSLNMKFFKEPTGGMGKPSFPNSLVVREREGIQDAKVMSQAEREKRRAMFESSRKNRDEFQRKMLDETASALRIDGKLGELLDELAKGGRTYRADFNVPSIDLDLKLKLVTSSEKRLCPDLLVEIRRPGYRNLTGTLKSRQACPNPDLGRIGSRILLRLDARPVDRVYQRFSDLRVGLPNQEVDLMTLEGYDLNEFKWVLLRTQIPWLTVK
jgi:hypothetical protein